ncbi:MAG: hypothetical protein KC643_25255, partial [Nitrospira sp.]|nr:hypothetical protein [Nitrospira sp.]
MLMTQNGWELANRVIFPLIASTSLVACVGQFETKPALTATCNIPWHLAAGLPERDAPPPTHNQGLHVLIWNIHDRVLPGSMFASDAHTEEEVICIGDLASRY